MIDKKKYFKIFAILQIMAIIMLTVITIVNDSNQNHTNEKLIENNNITDNLENESKIPATPSAYGQYMVVTTGNPAYYMI